MVCRQIREEGSLVPVLMLTARDSIDARIAGLDSGADDYRRGFDEQKVFDVVVWSQLWVRQDLLNLFLLPAIYLRYGTRQVR